MFSEIAWERTRLNKGYTEAREWYTKENGSEKSLATLSLDNQQHHVHEENMQGRSAAWYRRKATIHTRVPHGVLFFGSSRKRRKTTARMKTLKAAGTLLSDNLD